MSISLGVIMDPIGSIRPYKDSTLAMLLAAQARGWELWYMETADLSLIDGRVCGMMRALRVTDSNADWYELADAEQRNLADLHVVLMRKDPPVDMAYVHCTQLLELAEHAGVLVVNRPAALRTANEKLFAAWFPDLCAPTLVTRDHVQLHEFLATHRSIVLKPLNGMGGQSVFRVDAGDPNTNVIFETLTDNSRRLAMAQRFIAEISAGDKRILMVDGEPVPYALARIPAKGETRGNLAVGGRGEGVELSARDRAIAARVGPVLREHGLIFTGLDVIGDWLTEINVTSPTCIRELDRIYGLDIAGHLLDCIAEKLDARRQ